MLRFRRLQKELTLALILLTMLILFVVGVAGVWIILEGQQRTVRSIQQQVAQRVSQEVEHILSSAERNLLLTIQSTGFVGLSPTDQERILFDFLHGQQSFSYIALYNADNSLLFQTHRTQPNYAMTLSEQEHATALAAVLETGHTYFGELIYDRVTGEPSVQMAVPVFQHELGRTVQIIAGSLRFRILWQIMAREAQSTERSVFLVADDDRVIAHPDPSMVIAQQKYPIELSQDGYGLKGDSVIVAEWPLQLGEKNYRVISEQPLVSIFQAAYIHGFALAFALLLTLAAAVFFGRWMSRRITRPLDQLVAGVQKITAGELNQEVRVSGRNELAILGGQFNQMQRQLRDLIAQLRNNASVLEEEVASRIAAEQSLTELNYELELRVSERTQQLEQSLTELESAQASLVQSEKLAGLGSLVAGIAHELNTPIGNSLMMASTLQARTRELTKLMAEGLRKSDLDSYLLMVNEAGQILTASLNQSARLISSFKQVAVDQTSYQRRIFSLKEIIEEVILTMAPSIRHQQLRIEQKIDGSIELDSFPGPIGQILLNLVNNAMVHAFEGKSGDLWITSEADSEMVVLAVRDNGQGIAPDNLKRIFDPFFTSRLGQGGSGLGLNIVYNLVNGLLGGSIDVTSTLGRGTCFTISIPLVAPTISTDKTN